MRTYELMTILTPEIDPTDDKKRDSLITKLLGAEKYTVKSTKTLGKKHLAYPIIKKVEGTYVLSVLESEHIKADELHKNMKLIPDVLRFLLTVVEA